MPIPVCPGKLEKLLLCFDGSPESQMAVNAGFQLAQACGSKVVLLQVVGIMPEFESQAPDLVVRLEQQMREDLQAHQAEAVSLGLEAEVRMPRSLSPFSAIVHEAESLRPDLIIMGRHGRGSLGRLLTGSVTARVIGHCHGNVLVIPRDAALDFSRVLVGYDGSSFSQAAWKEALAIARHAGSKLIAVSVASEEGEIAHAEALIQQLLEEANQAGVPLQGLVPQGRPADDGIIQMALRHEVTLIVMGSHGRRGLSRLLMGSVAERVIGQATCPVLVVKKNK
jgi:nucleotide-binding universal stress UspA family protein